MKFSVVIATINATSLLQKCVEHLIKAEPDRHKYEIIIVDDCSRKEIQRWVKDYCGTIHANYIQRTVNGGFPTAANDGLKAAKGEHKILLNNDCFVLSPFMDEMDQAFERDPKIGVIGSRLIYENNRIQHAGMVRVPGTFNFVHIHKNKSANDPEVMKGKYYISVTGALVGIRGSLYEKIGGLNANYFLSCDDSEYCMRAWQADYRVFYNPNILAIHLEGESRGRTDEEKKKKAPQWFENEMATWKLFHKDAKGFDLSVIERRVDLANREIEMTPLKGQVKLEIGCGDNPQPGYIHLDVRAFPHVDIVCNFEKESLPFLDNEVDEILTNHVIEHISWRSLPFILKEWHRVLKPGGRIFLRTPDLEFICNTYLEGKTTPEAPQDENFITGHLADTITPAWWANIKLFAGQDYPSNFHFLCFDFDTIRNLFLKYGFEQCKRLHIKPVFSPGEIQFECYKPRGTAPKKTLLLKRRGALGDVILTTPIVNEIKRRYGSEIRIDVETDCGEVYKNNPYVEAVHKFGLAPKGYDSVIDLDLAYEHNPKMHIIDAYSKQAFNETAINKQTILVPTLEERIWAKHHAEVIVIHAARSWQNRTMPETFWKDLCSKLPTEKLIIVGSRSDFDPGIGVDLRGQLTLGQIAALCDEAKCFIGSDSGLLHIAGATQVPIVGIFTSAKAEHRLPFRRGGLGWNCKAIVPDVDCYGCLHEEKPPVTYVGCKKATYECIYKISVNDVLEAYKEVTHGEKKSSKYLPSL